MIFDLQKASMLKRISAFLFDFIMRAMLIVGIVTVLSAVFGYDAKVERFDEISNSYIEKYGVNLTEEQYGALTETEKAEYKALYDKANAEFKQDSEAARLYDLILNLTILMTVLGVVAGYLILEFGIPLIFKNGQTLGKKIFGIGVMRDDGVKINVKMLFVRSMLGKCTIEALVPLAMVMLILLGNAGMIGLIALLLLGALEIFLMIKTKTNSCIHDLLAYAVTVDMASQMIFDSPEALNEYKNKLHKETVSKANY